MSKVVRPPGEGRQRACEASDFTGVYRLAVRLFADIDVFEIKNRFVICKERETNINYVNNCTLILFFERKRLQGSINLEYIIKTILKALNIVY